MTLLSDVFFEDQHFKIGIVSKRFVSSTGDVNAGIIFKVAAKSRQFQTLSLQVIADSSSQQPLWSSDAINLNPGAPESSAMFKFEGSQFDDQELYFLHVRVDG